MATLIWTDASSSRRLLPGLALAGAAGGVFGPKLGDLLGAAGGSIAASATLALALVAGGWIAREGELPKAQRVVLALIGGVLAGALTLWAPTLATVLFAFTLSLALAPGRFTRGVVGELACCLPAATGAVAAGVVGGVLAGHPAFFGLALGAQGAILGALLALGIGAGEATRGLLVADAEPAGWVADILEASSVETRPLLEAAIEARRRLVQGVVGASWLDAWERRESLDLGRDLLEAAARAVRDADAALFASLGLSRDAGDLEGHAELSKARSHIRESLEQQIERARSEAERHAASLSRMVGALTERAALRHGGRIDLSTRAELLEERVLSGFGGAVRG